MADGAANGTIELRFRQAETALSDLHDELLPLKALPLEVAKIEGRITGLDVRVTGLREDLSAKEGEWVGQQSTLADIRVKLATLQTKMAFWSALGALAGSAIVGVVVAFVSHSPVH